MYSGCDVNYTIHMKAFECSNFHVWGFVVVPALGHSVFYLNRNVIFQTLKSHFIIYNPTEAYTLSHNKWTVSKVKQRDSL